MSDSQAGQSSKETSNDIFTVTSWTVVMAAQKENPEAFAALESLCRSYWFPIYAYIRHRGYQPIDAEDLTQGFFAFLLDKERLKVVDRSRGKFRAFLITTINGFLANQWRRERAQKRGGRQRLISLDAEIAEHRFQAELVTTANPENLFERAWARQVLQHALIQLEESQRASGKGEIFENLKPFLTGSTESSDYEFVGAQLNLSSGTVAVNVHRLRQQYRKFLRQEIKKIVGNEGEIEEEMRHLFSICRKD